MERIPFERKDIRFLLICSVILVGCTLFSWKYFHKAFPEASIQFRYTRSDAQTIATQFLSNIGNPPPSEYRHASRFDYDNHAKLYLEKELGLEKASQYFGNPIQLWYWQHRWFKPATKEEFKVYVSPEGKIVYFDHPIDENAMGAMLSEDSARALAEQFLQSVMNLSIEPLELMYARKKGLPHREDWTFEWRLKGFEPLQESSYRYQVKVFGNRIHGYHEYLFVPQQWMASYEKLRSYNQMITMIATVGFVLTIAAMVVVFFINVRKRNVPWKLAAIFGIIAFILVLFNELNTFPLIMYDFDTSSSFSGEVMQILLASFLTALMQGWFIFLLVAWAEPIYRERMFGQIAIRNLFTLRGLQTKSAFKGIYLGITLTAFFLAYQVTFYLVSQRYGAWSPSEVPYTDLLNTAMPWLAVLFIGFFPAVSEEFLSRVFSIPFLQKLFRGRFTWLAVTLPAMIWGFMHSNYPQQPFYIRGLEVGIAGIIIGYVMLKWGVLPALVWHYTVDALYTAMLLFRSDNWYFIFTAAVATGIMVIPLLVALMVYILKGGFASEVGLLNGEIDQVAEATEDIDIEIDENDDLKELEPSTQAPQPTVKPIWTLIILLIGIFLTVLPIPKLGDFIEFPVSREQALNIAKDTLRATGWANTDTLENGVYIQFLEGGAAKDHPIHYYLKRWRSIPKVNDWFSKNDFVSGWVVRFWKPENRLRFTVTVDSRNGKVRLVTPYVYEEMVGDSLSKDSARALIESELAKRGIQLSEFELKEFTTNKLPHRIDHSFQYEARPQDPRHLGEAKYRVSATLQGNWITIPDKAFHKLPEQWQRNRTGSTLFRTVMHNLKLVILGLFYGWAAVLLILKTRTGEVPWKKAFQLSLVPGILLLIGQTSQFYLLKEQYFQQITLPWGVFQTTLFITWLLSSGVIYLSFVLILAFVLSYFPNVLDAFQGKARRRKAKSVLLATLLCIGVWLIVQFLRSALAAWKPQWIAFVGWDLPKWLAIPFPMLMMLSDWVRNAFQLLAMIAFTSFLWRIAFQNPLQRILLVISVLLIIPSQAVEAREMLMVILQRGVLVLGVYLTLTYVIRNDYLAVAVGVAVLTALQIFVEAVGYQNQTVLLHGIAFIILAIGSVLWWLFSTPQATVPLSKR
ncbi:MAG: CPBP family intramembrane metalloprotease [bacterium]|nr:CPBP family intramembrane metalloprotease [bacterium]